MNKGKACFQLKKSLKKINLKKRESISIMFDPAELSVLAQDIIFLSSKTLESKTVSYLSQFKKKSLIVVVTIKDAVYKCLDNSFSFN